MTEYILRDYQERTVDRAFKVPDQPIFCAATGSGKTVMQAFVARRALEQGYASAILTPRQEIFTQTHEALDDICGLSNVATLSARSKSWNSFKPIHVVSWPTLISRMKKSETWMPKVDFVQVDECHLSLAPKMLEILKYYNPRAKVIGWTATPARATGLGLGDFYSEIVPVTTVPKLIADGYLNPNEYWAGSFADVSGIGTMNGDYNNKQLALASMPLVGDIVENWLRLASDRHTIVFAVNIGHAEALTDRFLEAGVVAAAIHNKLDDVLRDEIVRKFKAGIIQVLVNVTIASYGFDSATVDCTVLARRTKSIVLHLQMLGRGMRPGMDTAGLIDKYEWTSPSWWKSGQKRVTMVLDHADNVRQLGEAEDLYRWVLTKGKKACTNVTKEKAKGAESELNTCESCGYEFKGRRDCPKCGWEIPFTRADVATIDADLVRISEERNLPVGEGFPNREMFFRMLKGFATEKKYKVGFIAVKYKSKTGDYPPNNWENMAGIPPSPQVLAWLKKEQQNYARRKSYGRSSEKANQSASS